MDALKLDQFTAFRPRLLGLAYRLLGEASEAQDVVQDAYLRWERSGSVDRPEAWLTRVVTNLCLNRLTSARARRETYVGPWLPEPVFTVDGSLGPLETAEQRETLTFGMLLLLERLTPPERAAFVLREAFGYSHREVGEILDRDEAHARQLYHRARHHLAEHRQRFRADPEEGRRITERFLAASLTGDLAGLERLLAEDVTAWADGGGQASAARRPVFGRDRVARYLSGFTRYPLTADAQATITQVNAAPAVVVHRGGTLVAVIAADCLDGRIVAVRTVLNPAKLVFAAGQAG